MPRPIRETMSKAKRKGMETVGRTTKKTVKAVTSVVHDMESKKRSRLIRSKHKDLGSKDSAKVLRATVKIHELLMKNRERDYVPRSVHSRFNAEHVDVLIGHLQKNIRSKDLDVRKATMLVVQKLADHSILERRHIHEVLGDAGLMEHLVKNIPHTDKIIAEAAVNTIKALHNRSMALDLKENPLTEGGQHHFNSFQPFIEHLENVPKYHTTKTAAGKRIQRTTKKVLDQLYKTRNRLLERGMDPAALAAEA